MSRSTAASVAIPALDIQSPLVRLGLETDTGALEVPTDYALAGWYADGPYPGQANGPPAVIVGHVDSLTGPAVFFRLREIQPDTEIHVTRADGSTAVFRVVDAQQYPKAALPDAEVYARRQPAELVLITCTGQFDDRTGSYLDNFVVTARLDPEASGVPT
ncbi:MAG: sortase [Actinobacteria bacterium]|nr:sortase [Actinomycetota bacterium]